MNYFLKEWIKIELKSCWYAGLVFGILRGKFGIFSEFSEEEKQAYQHLIDVCNDLEEYIKKKDSR